MTESTKKCINCKHAWLNKQERAFHRLMGKPFLFECLLTRNYHPFNIEEIIECSTRKHNCDEHKPCPENKV